MFVIVNNNRVIFGPKGWNKRIFEEVILDDLGITATLESTNPDQEVVTINSTTKIYPVEDLVLPNFNSRIQRLDGPFWHFFSDRAQRYFTPGPLPLDAAKVFLKDQVTSSRYEREISGFTHHIGDITVSIDTTRDGRRIFIETYAMMSEGETLNWKFPEAWLTITKSDLGTILGSGRWYIQSCFNWELSKHNEIDACSSLVELAEIDIS